MQVYSKSDEQLFSPTNVFEKWAVVEVSTHNDVPVGMESYSLPGGQYAVFIHNGPASAAPKTMRHIFGKWLPDSEYELDDRGILKYCPKDMIRWISKRMKKSGYRFGRGENVASFQ